MWFLRRSSSFKEYKHDMIPNALSTAHTWSYYLSAISMTKLRLSVYDMKPMLVQSSPPTPSFLQKSKLAVLFHSLWLSKMQFLPVCSVLLIFFPTDSHIFMLVASTNRAFKKSHLFLAKVEDSLFCAITVSWTCFCLSWTYCILNLYSTYCTEIKWVVSHTQ